MQVSDHGLRGEVDIDTYLIGERPPAHGARDVLELRLCCTSGTLSQITKDPLPGSWLVGRRECRPEDLTCSRCGRGLLIYGPAAVSFSGPSNCVLCVCGTNLLRQQVPCPTLTHKKGSLQASIPSGFQQLPHFHSTLIQDSASLPPLAATSLHKVHTAGQITSIKYAESLIELIETRLLLHPIQGFHARGICEQHAISQEERKLPL